MIPTIRWLTWCRSARSPGEGEGLLKPGGLVVAYDLRHDDFESLSPEEIDAVCERFEQALGLLGDNDLVHVVHHRLPAPGFEAREFPTRAAGLVDAERRAAFGSERYWLIRSRLYWSHYFPPETKTRLSAAFFASGGAAGGPAELAARDRTFHERANAFADALSGVARVKRLSSAELFHDLHLCTTGLEHPIAVPSVPIHIDEVLADQTFFGGLHPRVGQLHIRPVAINAYPAETLPELLWFVLNEPGRLRFTLRWIPLDSINHAASRQPGARPVGAETPRTLAHHSRGDERSARADQPPRRGDGRGCRGSYR